MNLLDINRFIDLKEFRYLDNFFYFFDEPLSPLRYLNEKEQYFANWESWKLTFEETYLDSHPYLVREPVRHKKIYRFKRVSLPR